MSATRAIPTHIDPHSTKPLFHFAAVAVPTGWVLLSIPLLLDLPMEPYVLLTLAVGLLAPAVVLTRRDPTATMKALLRDCLRPPRPSWLAIPAVAMIPALTWAFAAPADAGKTWTGNLVVSLAINIVSSVLIINLWEEMAWTGFVQRRAMARGARWVAAS
jgi:hypothetical protein